MAAASKWVSIRDEDDEDEGDVEREGDDAGLVPLLVLLLVLLVLLPASRRYLGYKKPESRVARASDTNCPFSPHISF